MLERCAIVIATNNRAAVLRRTLEQLYELPEQPRVVVVDNGSSDDTAQTCKHFGDRVRLYTLPRNLGAAARTIGAREAGTPYVAFCDDDCVWTSGSLARAVERLDRHAGVAVMNGRVVVGEGEKERPDPACEAMRAEADGACSFPGIPIVYFMAGASVVRRAPFLEAGGYHVRYFIGAEESLISLDLAARGWQLWYCDDLVVRHRPAAINRDPDARRRLVLRNRLWTVMLRRSWASIVRIVAAYVRLAGSDRIARTALREAIAGLPWVLRERRRIPIELERRVEALDSSLPV